MRAGGKVEGDLWTTRVKALRAGDWVRCGSWGGTVWGGGEVLVVLQAAPSGNRDGYWHIDIFALDCPSEERQLAMLPDDEVTLASRSAEPTEKPVKAKKPKKGEQLKLL